MTITAPGGASAEAKRCSGNSAAADDSSRAPSRSTARRSREPPSAGAVAPHNARLGLRPSLTEVAAGHAHDLAPGMLSTPKRRVGRSDFAFLAVIVAAKNGGLRGSQCQWRCSFNKQTLIGPTLFAPHGPTMGAFLRRKRDCTQALELQPMPQEGTLPPCQGVDPAWRSGCCEDGHWHAGRGRTRCYAKTARRHRACGGHVGIFTLRVLSFNLMIFEICRQTSAGGSAGDDKNSLNLLG